MRLCARSCIIFFHTVFFLAIIAVLVPLVSLGRPFSNSTSVYNVTSYLNHSTMYRTKFIPITQKSKWVQQISTGIHGLQHDSSIFNLDPTKVADRICVQIFDELALNGMFGFLLFLLRYDFCHYHHLTCIRIRVKAIVHYNRCSNFLIFHLQLLCQRWSLPLFLGLDAFCLLGLLLLISEEVDFVLDDGGVVGIICFFFFFDL